MPDPGNLDETVSGVRDGDHDAAMERRMEITQLQAGDILTVENAAEIQAILDELDEESERGADAYDLGLQAGRTEAAGKNVTSLLQQIDVLEMRLAAANALVRFYSALARSPEAQAADTSARNVPGREGSANASRAGTRDHSLAPTNAEPSGKED